MSLLSLSSSSSARTTRRLSRLLQIGRCRSPPPQAADLFLVSRRERHCFAAGSAAFCFRVAFRFASAALVRGLESSIGKDGRRENGDGATLSHGRSTETPPPSSQADKPFPLSSPLSPSASSPTLLLPSHGRGMRCSRGLLARCFASARTAAVQSNSLSSSSIVAASALKSWPGGAAMCEQQPSLAVARVWRRRHCRRRPRAIRPPRPFGEGNGECAERRRRRRRCRCGAPSQSWAASSTRS